MSPTAAPNSYATACGVQSPAPQTSFWLAKFHGAQEGTSPFLVNGSNYQVFRNVKDFGAKGDGTTDDTAAFNAAISRKFWRYSLVGNF